MDIDLGCNKVIKASNEVGDISIVSRIMLEDIYAKYGKILDNLVLVDSSNLIFQVKNTDKLVKLSTGDEYPTCLKEVKEILEKVVVKQSFSKYFDGKKYDVILLVNTVDKKSFTVNGDFLEYSIVDNNYVCIINNENKLVQNVDKINTFVKILYSTGNDVYDQVDVVDITYTDLTLETALALYLIHEDNCLANTIEDVPIYVYYNDNYYKVIVALKDNSSSFNSIMLQREDDSTENKILRIDGRNTKYGSSVIDAHLYCIPKLEEVTTEYGNACVYKIMENYGIGDITMAKMLNVPPKSLDIYIQESKYDKLPTDVLANKSLLAREYIENCKKFMLPEEYKSSIEYLEGVKLADEADDEVLNVAKYIYDNVLSDYKQNNVLSGNDKTLVDIVIREIMKTYEVDNTLSNLEIMCNYLYDDVLPKSMLSDGSDKVSVVEEFIKNQMEYTREVRKQDDLSIKDLSQLIYDVVEEVESLDDIATTLIKKTPNMNIIDTLNTILDMLCGTQNPYGLSNDFNTLIEDGLSETLIKELDKYIRMVK